MKVLILAYDFPPLISAGANRPFSWYQYFAEYGVHVTVITRDWASNTGLQPTGMISNAAESETGTGKLRRIIKAAYKPNLRDKLVSKVGNNKLVGLRKALSYLYLYLEYIAFFFDSRAGIYYEADNLLRSEKFDFIIATGEPFILFRYASLLSDKYHTPWVADYRDAWTKKPGESEYKGSFQYRVLNAFNKILERRYLKNVLFATTVAPPPYLNRLVNALPGKRVELIYNGYFDEHYSGSYEKENINDKFIIIYTGTIYPFQKVFTFLAGLEKMLAKYPDAAISIEFYGLNDDFKQKLELFNENVAQHMVFKGKIPASELPAKLRNSNLLLLLAGPGVDSMASKAFDYLAAKRKIMLVESDNGNLHNLVINNNAGEVLNSSSEVCNFLVKEYAAFLQRGRKNIEVQSVNDGFYSRRKQAGILIDLLKGHLK